MHDALQHISNEDELERKNLELAFALNSLSRFTHSISHELKSPVSTLNNLLEMLSSENRAQLDSAGNELLDMILLSARRTQDMVSGTFEYSNSALPPEKLKEIDSRTVLDEVLSEAEPHLRQKSATVTIGDMPVITSCARSVKQIFQQLIANALKFNNLATPTIQVFARPVSEGIEFVVADDGIGVPSNQHDAIFDLFTRLHARSEYDGAGLGLPIVLQIVRALNGRMWVSQTRQAGAAFHVLLPEGSPSR